MTPYILPTSAAHTTYSQAMLNSSPFLEYTACFHNYQPLRVLVPLLERTSLFLSWIAQFNPKIQLKYHFFSDFPDSPKQVTQSLLWVPHSIWIIIVRVLTTRDCCFSIYIYMFQWIEQRRSIINICSRKEWMDLLPSGLPRYSTVEPHLFTCNLLLILF